MSEYEICWDSALELGRKIKAKKISSVEATQIFLKAIREFNPALNAIVTVDEEFSIEGAKRADKLIHAGELTDSPLAGVPFLPKDLDVTAGMRTTFGSLLHKDYIPKWDMLHIDRLKQAGCVVLGKTNTPEDGLIPNTFNPVFGVSRNPWNLERCVGGSSGGAGAAVAAGLGPLATGSDGAGSIRVPAALNGCFGFKPTFGTIPFGPKGIGIMNTIGHLGPMTRFVEDAAAMLDEMAGGDERDRWSLPQAESFLDALDRPFVAGKIAYSTDLGYATVEGEVKDLFMKAIDDLDSAGWPIQEDHPGFSDPLRAIDVLVAAEWGTIPMLLEGKDPEAYELQDAPVKRLAEQRKRVTLDHLWDANQTRKDLCVAMGSFFEDYDLLITPALTRTAFEVDRAFPAMRNSPDVDDYGFTSLLYPFNLTGDPACSIPIGRTSEGLPVGLQIIGPRHRDDLVLQAALAYEAISGFCHNRPPHGVGAIQTQAK